MDTNRPPEPKLLEFLTPYDNMVADLALALREIVLEEAPDATELIHNVKYAVALNYTFSGRMKEAFCCVVVYRHHVNLGFHKGAHLADPRKLLEGGGKGMRHIRIGN